MKNRENTSEKETNVTTENLKRFVPKRKTRKKRR